MNRRSAIPASWILCLIVILIACWLRWSTLTFESIWADEAFSIELVSHGWLDVVRGTAADQHPPLYYLVLKLWTTGGLSVFQFRYLSAAFSILEVTLVAAWGRKVLGLQAGLVAGLLLALSPLHTQWAQSVRMYSFVSLLCTLSCILLYRNILGRGGLLACAVVNVLAIYTHNVAIFLVGVQLVLVSLFSARHKNWGLAKNWMRTNLLLGLLYVPWLFVLFRQATQNTMTWAGPLPPQALVRIFAPLTPENVSTEGAIASIVWLGCCALLALYGIWRARAKREPVLFLFTWFFGAFFGMFLVSQFVQFFVSKLLIWLLSPLFLLVGHGLQRLPSRWAKIAACGILFGLLVSALFAQQSRLDDQDCRGVAHLLDQETSAADIVLFNAGATSMCVDVYGDMEYAFLTYPVNYSVLESGFRADQVTAEFADETVSSMQQEYQGIWLVEFWPHWFDPGGYFEDRIQTSAIVEQEWQFRGLRVRYFRFRGTE